MDFTQTCEFIYGIVKYDYYRNKEFIVYGVANSSEEANYKLLNLLLKSFITYEDYLIHNNKEFDFESEEEYINFMTKKIISNGTIDENILLKIWPELPGNNFGWDILITKIGEPIW